MNDLTVLQKQFEPLAPNFAEALGGVMAPERLIRTVLVSVERSPKLLQCNRQSLFNAAMSAAVLGLEVDGVTGQAFLIPFGDRVQLVIGYKGFNTIAARAGITITGEVVREGDEFEYDLGEGYVSHKPSLAAANGRRIIAAWAKASAKNRPAIVTVMGIADIEAVKARSPGAKKSDSPWNDPTIGFPAMASKTVKRRLARSTPLSVFHLAAALDEAFEERGRHAFIGPDKTLRIEGDGPIVDGQANQTPSMAQLTTSATANGGAAASSPSGEADVTDEPPADPLLTRAREKASDGEESWNAWFAKLTPKQAIALQPHLPELQQRVQAAGP